MTLINLTLLNLKKYLKVTSILIFLVVYGLIFFILGKNSDFGQILRSKIENKAADNTIEQPLPGTDVQSGTVISSFVKLCSNTLYGFEVAYPKDWFTTYDLEEQKCTFFAPFSFVVNSKTQNNIVPVRIEPVKIEDWLSTVKFYDNPNDFQSILSSVSIVIDGRSVKKIRSVATGAGTIPRGFEKLSFLIFDSQTPLVLYYQQLDAKDNVANYEKILGDMSSTLRYF